MSEIKLDAGALQAVIQKAILDSIDANQRASILAQAIDHLMQPVVTKGPYGGDTRSSPLMAAFHTALENIARNEIYDFLKDNETVKKQVRDLVEAAWNKTLSEHDNDMIDKMMKALASFFQDPRRY